MNGKYVIYYALILVAMAGILVVGLFDWRLVNYDEPIQATKPKRASSPPLPVIDPAPPLQRLLNSRRMDRSNDFQNVVQIGKTNLHQDGRPLTQPVYGDSDPTQDECSERRVRQLKAGVVEKNATP